jgi:hypothetical protein
MNTYHYVSIMLHKFSLFLCTGFEVSAVRQISSLFKHFWARQSCFRAFETLKLLNLCFIFSVRLLLYFGPFLLARKEVRAVSQISNVLENRDLKKIGPEKREKNKK